MVVTDFVAGGGGGGLKQIHPREMIQEAGIFKQLGAY